VHRPEPGAVPALEQRAACPSTSSSAVLLLDTRDGHSLHEDGGRKPEPQLGVTPQLRMDDWRSLTASLCSLLSSTSSSLAVSRLFPSRSRMATTHLYFF
jgi:hypothetical protein